jgi:hypothetical protein
MSAKHEWLNLLEVSGPFLAVPVLREVFPQGLEELDSSRAKRLRSAYEEWRDAVDGDDADRDKLHAAWIDEVLRTALEADDQLLKAGKDVPASLVELPEHDTTIAPEFVFVDPTHGAAVLAPVHVFPPDTDLSASMKFGGLSCSAGDRMALHLRALNVPFGIVTNGERWMLVYAPAGHVATFASWYARIWGQEPATLRAFTSLLGVRRFFAPAQDRLPALFERSLKHQDEVTDALGDQVRRAIEVLVQALDRADQDRNRELLRDVKPQELYEAGLTVMMRLVFLLAAEERGLLLLGEPRYDSFYAVSTLRMQLRAESDEILERRRAAWSRLLAVFRAVFGGIDHPTLRLPAMGGSLFDPDRFPFLEGRLKGTSWRQHRAEPLPVDDRTVLLLLEAIQTFEGRTLSYRALDVEQIGHVYEGLLERTVSRVEDVTLELEAGAQAKDARVSLGELESARLDGQAAVTSLLVERSKRSQSAIEKELTADVEPQQSARLLSACRGDVKLRDRLEPYVRLMRTDPWGYPLVHPKGAFVVVLGPDRRETGTHYTPKSLTERIVEETLTPLVYDGPAKGAPRAEWKLKTPEQLLDLKVCDPAMGSGAFLVQACRFLSARLVEAWAIEEAAGRVVDLTGQVHEPRTSVERMPAGEEARAENARRIVAERCLYGVDLNPLAVELAKLSLWLVTLSKGRPFGFLDHNLRCGDSLLGISRLEQLTELSLDPSATRQGRLFGKAIEKAVAEAVALRRKLHEIPIRDIRDVEAMATLDADARKKLKTAELIADAFIGVVFAADGGDVESRIAALAADADRVVRSEERAIDTLVKRASKDLAKDSPSGGARRPFHWPLEFPDVFQTATPGFDAVVGNPPFLNAIEHAGARTQTVKAYYARVYPVFAQGAYDLCLLFWARTMQHLLRETGRYGLLGPTALLSDGGAWKKWVHQRWRPVSMWLYPVDFFSKARIRTAAVVGATGESRDVLVASLDSEVGLFHPTSRIWDQYSANWYEIVSGVSTLQDARDGSAPIGAVSLVALSDIADVGAGCTTADAYNLKAEIDDSDEAHGLKLITTGAIDRYTSKWGRMKIRYLKDDYIHPRWPTEPSDRGVERALCRQNGAKILVGGLTAVLEAWFDTKGDSAGTVQTWVVRPRKELLGRASSDASWWLTAVINSAYFSRIFVSRFGAQAMSGRQITIKKASLQVMPVPRPTLGEKTSEVLVVDRLTSPFGASAPALDALLVQVCKAMQLGEHPPNEFAALDKMAHFFAGARYGRTQEECQSDYRWWCDRANVDPAEDDWATAVRLLTGDNRRVR